MRQGDEIVYVGRACSERSGVQVVRAVGGRARCIAFGRQAVPGPRRCSAGARLCGPHGLPSHTRNSITELPRLEARAGAGEPMRNGARRRRARARRALIAAGILDDPGELVAGLWISAPADGLEEAWLERLRATAASVSASLGRRG